MINPIRGTDGYAAEAENLLIQYEALTFETSHSDVLDLIPKAPGSALDIGSGTGRDAAHFAAMGHRVVAVEPTDEMRGPAAKLHPSPSIEWIDDGLPDLTSIVDRAEDFDLVWLSAVWMHLDLEARERGMPVLGSLLRPGGLLFLSLHHGPVPSGRRMFDVSAAETIALAEAERMRPVVNRHTESKHERNIKAGVTWTRLVFEKAGRD